MIMSKTTNTVNADLGDLAHSANMRVEKTIFTESKILLTPEMPMQTRIMRWIRSLGYRKFDGIGRVNMNPNLFHGVSVTYIPGPRDILFMEFKQ